ncbi:FeoA family protein [Clostridium taeniosporum]|uniref:Ferrous iron transport protein A n=1 Tax=Clostridium taeniosporum TaxID=394958 RepID=A0A1D7XKG5_9CLOT|nr:FeoA family protein [Clostridium taeniosporum]AOR23589.1 ferrous iron transport protein A [Clostridium taeniosporum]
MNNNSLNNLISLNKLPLGNKCRVNKLNVDGIIRRRFLDLGLINGTEIESLGQSPSGDPIAYLIRGAVIAIRSEDASKILVETI